MFIKKFFNFDKEELVKLFIVISLLSLMFSYIFDRFSYVYSYFEFFFIFLFWFSILFFLKLFLLKYVGYTQAVKLKLDFGYLNRYGILKYQTAGKYLDEEANILKFKKKGFSMPIVSLFLFIISFGFFILPNMFKYKWEKIPHKLLGSKNKFENKLSFFYPQDVSEERISRAITSSFLAFPITGLLTKIFVGEGELYFYLLFSLFWIGFFNIFPFFGTLGYQLFIMRNYYWFVIVTILFIFLIALIFFDSVLAILLVGSFSVLLILSVKFYKDLVR